MIADTRRSLLRCLSLLCSWEVWASDHGPEVRHLMEIYRALRRSFQGRDGVYQP